MKRKKLMALGFALIMMLNLSAVAFAATGDVDVANGQATITIPTEIKAPIVKVTIGNPAKVIVNPYQMSVTPPNGGTAVTSSLISAPVLITSESNVGLAASAAPYATSSTGVEIVGTPEGVTNKKAVYMFLELKKSDSATVPTVWNTAYAEGTCAVVEKDSAVEAKAAKLDIKAATFKADGTTVDAASYAAFNIIGQSGQPAAGEAGWASNDNITLNVIFTFTPKYGAGE